MSKITKATFKSFIKKAGKDLFINVSSTFDGMTDGIEGRYGGFTPVGVAPYPSDNNLGISGVWLVGGSRNYFQAYDRNDIVGIEVSNCCGNFTVGIKIK
jgi:hypothetical protein